MALDNASAYQQLAETQARLMEQEKQVRLHTEELALAKGPLDTAVEGKGWMPIDTHDRNLGKLGRNRYAIIDPGSVASWDAPVVPRAATPPRHPFDPTSSPAARAEAVAQAMAEAERGPMAQEQALDSLRGNPRQGSSSSWQAPPELAALGEQAAAPAQPGSSPLTRAVLALLGADKKVQAEILERVAHSRATSGLALPDVPSQAADHLARLAHQEHLRRESLRNVRGPWSPNG